MTNRLFAVRALLLTLGLALAARPALAGPPLLCHPIDPGTAAVLPWGSGASWKAPLGTYDRSRLVSDTLRLLTPDAPIAARMENLRRATIYAAEDRHLAADLLGALIARTQSDDARAGRDALAWFDAGYLIETYRDAFRVYQWGMLDAAERRRWALTSAPTRDGLAMVRKAMGLTAAHPAMSRAESLIVEGRTADR